MSRSNLRLGLLLGLLLSAAIVATNVVWPAMAGHPSADSDLSESIGWLVLIAILCCAGYFTMGRTAKLRDAAIAGATISFVAIAMAMITFLVIDNLFLDIVAQQPEKIWLFQHSGFRDMRSYLNHTNLRAFWTALPVTAIFGGVCGIAGGYIRRFLRNRTS